MLLDAHNHLHDARLSPWRAEIMEELRGLGIRGAVVNGTRESDWAEVAALAREAPWVMPSFGLHPWHVNARGPEWRESLAAQVFALLAAALARLVSIGGSKGTICPRRWNVSGGSWTSQREKTCPRRFIA